MKPAAPARLAIFVDYKARDGKGRVVRGVITIYDLPAPEALALAKDKLLGMGYEVMKVRKLNRFQLWLMARWQRLPRGD